MDIRVNNVSFNGKKEMFYGIKKLAEEKADILSKIDALENEESERISAINLSKKWRTANYEERKAVCNILIHKILLNEAGNCEVIWNV